MTHALILLVFSALLASSQTETVLKSQCVVIEVNLHK